MSSSLCITSANILLGPKDLVLARDLQARKRGYFKVKTEVIQYDLFTAIIIIALSMRETSCVR